MVEVQRQSPCHLNQSSHLFCEVVKASLFRERITMDDFHCCLNRYQSDLSKLTNIASVKNR